MANISKSVKTMILTPKNGKTPHARKLDPATASIEIGNIICRNKKGEVVQTISLVRYLEADYMLDAALLKGVLKLR